ncbi:hypothetical protein OG896_18550 [Streptomyces sp. NBC_00669]|uniref:hypothetical protein n=1 Tax=Streptomyces sp. NBC_00669 TaxID=2976011 RepID=UPI002E310861|nr:hypothetical protein [Streptomyces sp. NBC_00669]
MAADTWQAVRGAVIRFWQALQPDQTDAVASELTADQREAAAADLHPSRDSEHTLAELRAQWQARFRRLIAAHPEAASDLRGLLAELGPLPTTASAIAQHATASGSGRVYQAGRDQHITER